MEIVGGKLQRKQFSAHDYRKQSNILRSMHAFGGHLLIITRLMSNRTSALCTTLQLLS